MPGIIECASEVVVDTQFADTAQIALGTSGDSVPAGTIYIAGHAKTNLPVTVDELTATG